MNAAAKVNQPIRPYGDRKDDGRIQLSFTLPVAASGRAKEAARRLCEQMGLRTSPCRRWNRRVKTLAFRGLRQHAAERRFCRIVVPEVSAPSWSFKELNAIIRHHLGRKLVVVGACTGSDAHTVGIDAILNMKGYAGTRGSKRIRGLMRTIWVRKLTMRRCCRGLVSCRQMQSWCRRSTQRDVHRENAKRMIDLARRLGLRDVLSFGRAADRPQSLRGSLASTQDLDLVQTKPKLQAMWCRRCSVGGT